MDDIKRFHQAKEIFFAALDLPESERKSFIAEKCGDDKELFAEIKAIWDSHENARDFIETPALESVGNFILDKSDTKPGGTKIGAYQIEREIGRGGMGAVYLAQRADAQFEKRVAIKLIKPGFDTDEIIKRFRHERQILATLDHPNVAKLLDGGATDDGLPFLVMDYMEGLPLTNYCQENALDINERLNIFQKICSAVAYAHRNLIIHRDLKPSNILVTKDGIPKLLDFGIAKLLTPETNFFTLQTATNVGVMTPEYASPEQVKGETVTTATDIYSLGILLYELLTDSRPYNFTTKSLEKIVYTVCEVEPLRPSSLLLRYIQNESSLSADEQNPKSKIQNRCGVISTISF